MCSAPEDIECRSKGSQHHQNVTCTPQRGFACFNYKQSSQQCDDYQARVRCCHCVTSTTTETTPSTTVTTPTTTVTIVTENF